MKNFLLLFFMVFLLAGCWDDPEQELFKSAESEWKQRRSHNSA